MVGILLWEMQKASTFTRKTRGSIPVILVKTIYGRLSM